MRTFTLEVELELPLPRERVFPFFADARNLEGITPPWLHFHILTPRPIPMHEGALIDYRLRLHGIPIRWRTRIDLWDPPARFVDRQLRGPYRLWHHTHTFEERPATGTEVGTAGARTLVRDRVRYAVPGGRLVQRLFVGPQVDAIFRHRQRAIARALLGRDLPAYPEPVHSEER